MRHHGRIFLLVLINKSVKYCQQGLSIRQFIIFITVINTSLPWWEFAPQYHVEVHDSCTILDHNDTFITNFIDLERTSDSKCLWKYSENFWKLGAQKCSKAFDIKKCIAVSGGLIRIWRINCGLYHTFLNYFHLG